MNNEPNHAPLDDNYFRRLSKWLTGFKKKAAELKGKALVSNIERKAHQPIPCTICGKNFDGFNGFAAKKKVYCPDCQGKLDNGYVCLVTMDGKRFAFVRFPHASAKLQKEAAGKIFTVSSERMDKVEKNVNKPDNADIRRAQTDSRQPKP